MSKNVVIIGGRGRVASRLGRILSAKQYNVTSIVRAETTEVVNPYILDLEKSSVSDLKSTFEKLKPELVYWSAGAGGKPGSNGEQAEERTKAVDYEAAVRVFDAIEGLGGEKPRLVLVSAVDIRNREKPVPDYYTEKDKQMSDRVWTAIAAYCKWKLEADRNLMQRTGFRWTILRPGGLSDSEGKGTASVGRTHLDQVISRDDVASALAILGEREDADRFAIDMIGGETKLEDAFDAAIKEKKTWTVDELL